MASLSPRKAFNNVESPNTKLKQTAEQIAQSEIYLLMGKLDNFTVDLETKVDGLLHSQEQQFFKAYRGHLTNIRYRLTEMEKTIEEQQRKIEQYESEGELSKLIRKIKSYERELSEVYGTIAEKERVVQDYRVKNQVLQKVNSQLHDKLKQLMREQRELKRQTLIQQDDFNDSKEPNCQDDSNIFPTQLKDRPTDKTHDESLTALIAIDKQNNGQRRSLSRNDLEVQKLQKEVAKLRERNLSLLKTNVHVSSTHSELQNFFLSCVNDVKKHISIRNSMPKCDFEDFKKEDKVKLLIWVLSNDRVIAGLHTVLFGPDSNKSVMESNTTGLHQYDTPVAMEKMKASTPIGRLKAVNHNSIDRVRLIYDEDEKLLPELSDVKRLSRKRRNKLGTGYLTTKRFSDVY